MAKMCKPTALRLSGVGLLAGAALVANVLPSSAAPGHSGSGAKNVILLIGDGMGDSELTSARYYEYGAAGRLNMDAMPERSAVTTYSVNESDGQPDYVPDSASTATAWSTGSKTSDGRIGTSLTDVDLTNTMELAKRAGLRIGNVSTARITDATPAGAMAHVSKRGCEGPTQTIASCPKDATENGGPGSIAEQSIDLGVDVLLGGGADRYDQPDPGAPAKTVTQSAAAGGYDVVRTASALQAATLPVLGLFTAGHLPTERIGPQAAPGGVQAQCTSNPEFTDDIPTVDEMTATAISLLDRAPGKGKARARARRTVSRASTCRLRAPRSTSRTTRPTAAPNSVRRSRSTARCRWRSSSPRRAVTRR